MELSIDGNVIVLEEYTTRSVLDAIRQRAKRATNIFLKDVELTDNAVVADGELPPNITMMNVTMKNITLPAGVSYRLTNCHLSNVKIVGGDLQSFQMADSILNRCRFTVDRIVHSTFDRTQLYDCEFPGVVFSGCRFHLCKQRHCLFTDAKFRATHFSEGSIYATHFARATFVNSSFYAVSLDQINGTDINSDAGARSVFIACSRHMLNLSGFSVLGKRVVSKPDLREYETDQLGLIVYKTFGSCFTVPDYWRIEPGAVLTEKVDTDALTESGHGINVGSAEYIAREPGVMWECRIMWKDLINCVMPERSSAIRCHTLHLVRTISPTELKAVASRIRKRGMV